MKKITLIMGTNATGKSSLAREIISFAGGCAGVIDDVTYCNDGKTALIGDYSQGKKIEGVDSFGETKFLADKIKGIERPYIVFEGLKCGTFGLSIQKALFSGESSLVIFLYASSKTINERLQKRSGRGINSVAVLKQQKANLSAAIKYKEIGVPVMSFNTDNFTTQEIFEQVKKKLYEL